VVGLSPVRSNTGTCDASDSLCDSILGESVHDFVQQNEGMYAQKLKKGATLRHSLIVVLCCNVLQFLKSLPLKCETCGTKSACAQCMVARVVCAC
jgi:hypothetical protein